MDRIPQTSATDKLPLVELTTTLERFVEPVLMHLPEKQLREVAKLAVQGIIGGQSSLVTQMARGLAREDETVWPMAQALSRYEFGVWLAHFRGLDPGPLVPARSRESGLYRPLDCTLDCSRARALLRTPLPGVDEVLGRLATDDGRGGWNLSIVCD